MRTTLRFTWPLLVLSLSLPLGLTGCSDDDDNSNDNNNNTTDLCADVDCGAHGTCDDADGTCTCDTGYTGATCGDCAADYVLVGTECVLRCIDNTDCDDGLACNGDETCNAAGLCKDGTPVGCLETETCLEPDGSCVTTVLVDFEDLTLATESYWAGDATGVHTFTSGDATFWNYYDDEWGYWEGFAYSNTTDTTTPGFMNQYSAITGGGEGGSPNYGVGYQGFMGTTPELRFDTTDGYTIAGAYFTNTTYAYLSMRDSDGFAKQFGGDTGDDPDWFKLTIVGVDSTDATTGPVDLYLADYTFADNVEDYLVDDWTWVDLSSLGDIVGLRFYLSSTDNDAWGMMNTPAYFAIDSIRRVAP
jgi:hypothetical protein